jgi:hypothetical protein
VLLSSFGLTKKQNETEVLTYYTTKQEIFLFERPFPQANRISVPTSTLQWKVQIATNLTLFLGEDSFENIGSPPQEFSVSSPNQVHSRWLPVTIQNTLHIFQKPNVVNMCSQVIGMTQNL